MKIYINGRFLTQRVTGVQRYAIEMTRALDRLIDSDKKISKNEYIIIAPNKVIQEIKFKNIKIKKRGIFSGHIWEQLELPLYTGTAMLLNFCNCAPLLKKNQTITIHDAAIAAIPEAYSLLFRIWYKFMFTILGKRLDCIFTVSKFSKREINKYFNIKINKIHVVYNGLDHVKNIKHDNSILNKENLNRFQYILSVSSLNPAKNFQLTLRVAKKMSDTLFIIAGGGNKNVFRHMGIDIPANMRFIGYISDEELLSLYENALCFFFPSKYEGFGIPPLEAASCGCPVIASKYAAMPEVCGNSVIYVDVDDVNESLSILHRMSDSRIIYKDKLDQQWLMDRYVWSKSIIDYFLVLKNNNIIDN